MQVKSAFSHKESVQKEVKAALSQRATLSCEVADSKTEVRWYKDGKLLASTKAIHSEVKGKNRQLVIESLEKKDGGEYVCEAGMEKLIFKIQVEGRIHMTNVLLHQKILFYKSICSFESAVLQMWYKNISLLHCLHSPTWILCQGATAEGSESLSLQEGHSQLRGV